MPLDEFVSAVTEEYSSKGASTVKDHFETAPV
jgi:hypothetical protein